MTGRRVPRHAAFTVRPTQNWRWPGRSPGHREVAPIELPVSRYILSGAHVKLSGRASSLRQGLGVHRRFSADDFVEGEDRALSS